MNIGWGDNGGGGGGGALTVAMGSGSTFLIMSFSSSYG